MAITTCVSNCLLLQPPPEPQVLTKMKQQAYELSSWPETEDVPAEGGDSWKDGLQKELSDIW